MTNIYDIAIVGAGVAGSMATHRLINKYPNTKIILIDLGRPPGKRRRQIEGFMGSFPFGDGKFYLNNYNSILELTDGRKLKSVYDYILNWMNSIHPGKIINDTFPIHSLKKKMEKNGFEFIQNNFIQWKPAQIHAWCKDIASSFEEAQNLTYQFDTIIESIVKENDCFKLNHANGNILCKKLLFCPGRSGWRWTKEIFDSLNVEYENNYAQFGLKLEISSQHMKDLNKSHCLAKNETSQIELGPFSWAGTIVPEDHADLVLAAFRSNEERWKSEKVSFSLLKKMEFSNKGIQENERLIKLAFLLFNDRVSKEKIKTLMKKTTLLSELKEFDWIYETIESLNDYFPDLINKGYFYIPCAKTNAPNVRLSNKFEVESCLNLFLAGESANQFGILSAALMGMVAADSLVE